MRKPTIIDYSLLCFLALIWSSAFFNIKIATESFGPVTIAFLRVFLASIPLIILCYIKKIKIEVFSRDWYWFALIGFINLVIPFFFISYGIKAVQSNLAAILMSSTPLTSTILGHYFTKNEKFNLIKTVGVLIGFSGIVYLFSDNILINENNFYSALLILLGATGYVVGGVLTLKISNKKNENVTAMEYYSKHITSYISYLSWFSINRSCMVIEICHFKEKWLNFSISGVFFNTNFWNNFRIYFLERVNHP